MDKAEVENAVEDVSVEEELRREIIRLNAQIRALETEYRQSRELAQKEIAQTREQFTDLKQRLQQAEASNQFMRGYLARVQEDDVVREELLTVGEPDGEQRFVPKRKPTGFERPDDFKSPPSRGSIYQNETMHNMLSGEYQKKRRHWITY